MHGLLGFALDGTEEHKTNADCMSLGSGRPMFWVLRFQYWLLSTLYSFEQEFVLVFIDLFFFAVGGG